MGKIRFIAEDAEALEAENKLLEQIIEELEADCQDLERELED